MELTEQERICILENLNERQWAELLKLLVQVEANAAQVVINELPVSGRQPGDAIRNNLNIGARSCGVRLYHRNDGAKINAGS